MFQGRLLLALPRAVTTRMNLEAHTKQNLELDSVQSDYFGQE